MGLSKLIASLKKADKTSNCTYRVPRQWTREGVGYKDVSQAEYILEAVNSIKSQKEEPVEKPAGWSKEAVIYNFFVRSACAIDHDGDGVIGGAAEDATLNSQGVRETGTFVKAIAMLEYIKRLGCDTVYLLPITSIGLAARKGVLGSPYAIKNPFELDEHLSDPIVPDLSVDEQFAAFTELAHHLGLKVVLEFVFRTSSLDGDWVKEHPEWYYWIKDELKDRSSACPDGYGNPTFPKDDLIQIKRAAEAEGSGLVRTPAEVKEVLEQGIGELIEPPAEYQKIYTAIPESVEMTGTKWTGSLGSGGKARIPGAFADWPPDDVQPPWTDVTYLRMYGKGNERFNYMAYNTIRLYDPELAVEEKKNKDLWNTIASIVPSYQKRFGIDGVMVDMGHALPLELATLIQKEAKKNDPDFAFWEEKFFLDPVSPKTGYEAVVGPLISVLADFNQCKQYLFDLKSTPCRFFATGENHNTPRLSGRSDPFWAKAAWTIAAFLPGAIPFIHNGFELYETVPLNTGLGFSQKDLELLKDVPLGLFDAAGFNWEGDENLIQYIGKVIAASREIKPIIANMSPDSFEVMTTLPPKCLGFYRKDKGERVVAVIMNSDTEPVRLHPVKRWKCLLTHSIFSGKLTLPGRRVDVLVSP